MGCSLPYTLSPPLSFLLSSFQWTFNASLDRCEPGLLNLSRSEEMEELLGDLDEPVGEVLLCLTFQKSMNILLSQEKQQKMLASAKTHEWMCVSKNERQQTLLHVLIGVCVGI